MTNDKSMRVLFYYSGLVLQTMGFATMVYVFLLFFGRAGMSALLNLSLVGIVEFYIGYYLTDLSRTK
jgi:hypothetical protein